MHRKKKMISTILSSAEDVHVNSILYEELNSLHCGTRDVQFANDVVILEM